MALLPIETIALVQTERAENPKLRARDLAAKLGLTEAHLLAADVGAAAV